jgi:hypothetical protein
MNADGTGQSNITNNAASDEEPTWSPDGTKIAFGTDRDGNQEVYVVNPDGSNPTDLSNAANADFRPNWQPLVHNYARPRGATPMRISLVPAYKQCTAPNTVHSGSISSPSCEPPQPESSYLTVGTPDFNAQGPNSIGSVLFRVLPGPPEDDAISVSLTDVRCAGTSAGCSSGALSDYTDDLGFDATFRITDKGSNAGGVNRSATVTDLPLRFSVPCTATASTSVGSSCALNTTIRTVLGSSAIVAGQRSIWQLNGNVSLYDGGADGLSATRGDNTLFVVGGLFNP